MITLAFLAFLAFAAMVALTDWRRGWLLAVVVGILQDPVRKLTPGVPVEITFSILVVYLAIMIACQRTLQQALKDFARRFASLWTAFVLLFAFLLIAAANGLINFGIGLWKVPMLSLIVYLAPLPAILIGYIYLQREEGLYQFFRFYSIVTSIALIGSVLEYLRVDSAALGMVSQQGDYIRHLPGVQIRMISGFYRAPDIMAWHASTLTSIAIAMVVRGELGRRTWPWMAAAAWGFFNCMISGRRKAIYFVAVFAAVFVWGYIKRLKPAQIVAFVGAAVVLALVVDKISSNEQASVYAKGALTTREEVTERLEGGVIETFRQFGIMGAGLGTATQGAQHFLTGDRQMSWQEGGLGKLAVELGLPGLLAAAFFAWTAFRYMLKIARHPDIPESSQLARVTLFALVIANVANFAASAQAYSDPVLALITTFLAGCLFAAATLDERAPAPEPVRHSLAPATA